MLYYSLLLLGILFNVAAQILVKSAALKIDNTLESFGDKIKPILLNPSFIGALLLYGISFLVYTFVLTRLELSRAYPISSVGAIFLIFLFSILFFNEPLTPYKMFGFVFSSIGIVLLFLT